MTIAMTAVSLRAPLDHERHGVLDIGGEGGGTVGLYVPTLGPVAIG